MTICHMSNWYSAIVADCLLFQRAEWGWCFYSVSLENEWGI